MSRNTPYCFVSTDSTTVVSHLIAAYEKITGHTLQPADPDRLFISWVADAIIKERVNQNYVGNQNIPSRAEGENLDALGEWIYSLKRKEARSAQCTMRFHIVQEQDTAISIPKETKVSDSSRKLVWRTTVDAVIPIGQKSADVIVKCDTAGLVGNGYAIGQINNLVDVDNILFFDFCENVTESDGGADREDDDTYFQMMRKVLDSYSTAGSEGSYIYWAKSVSTEITDVKAVRPRILRKETIPVVTNNDGERCAFMGGNHIDYNTLIVRGEGAERPAALGVDYYVNYINGLLKITLRDGGSVATVNNIDVTVEQDLAGHVYIYALMNDGTIASDTIKEAIYAACSEDYVRPLTDYVAVQDPEIVSYDIDFTYYISYNSQLSLSDIQAAVDFAVNEYVKWQRAKLGRDINPSKLASFLMQSGIKRFDITSPKFTSLRSGDSFDVPQIATLGTITVTNGGYEDE